MPHNLFCISYCILMCVSSCGQIKLNCPFSFRYTFEFSREREECRILVSSIKPIKHSFHWITYADVGNIHGIRLHTHAFGKDMVSGESTVPLPLFLAQFVLWWIGQTSSKETIHSKYRKKWRKMRWIKIKCFQFGETFFANFGTLSSRKFILEFIKETGKIKGKLEQPFKMGTKKLNSYVL